MTDFPDMNPTAPPSGVGCLECHESGGWWLHLRRCAACGHIGCCDNSPAAHATAHVALTGHPIITSFEPEEEWFYDYRTHREVRGRTLVDPQHHPLEQSVPGPADRVPGDWQSQLNP